MRYCGGCYLSFPTHLNSTEIPGANVFLYECLITSTCLSVSCLLCIYGRVCVCMAASMCVAVHEKETEAVRAAGGSSEFTNAARLREHGKTSRH